MTILSAFFRKRMHELKFRVISTATSFAKLLKSE